jgi:hypothetical protein
VLYAVRNLIRNVACLSAGFDLEKYIKYQVRKEKASSNNMAYLIRNVACLSAGFDLEK